MNNNDCVYVRAEVCGIQKYICSTGKLKEMIGGSEIIRLFADSFYRDYVVKPLGLKETDEPAASGDWYIPVQTSAGVVCLILPDEEKARLFLETFSRETLAHFPGLPVAGAFAPMIWNEKDSYRDARREADRRVAEARARWPVADGAPMLPILKSCRLDGLPVSRDDQSLPSLCRSQKAILDLSRERLRGYLKHDDYIKPRWADDLDEMLGDEASRVALIRMDGNDFGVMLSQWLESASGKDMKEGVKTMRSLSRKIDDLAVGSFGYAARGVLNWVLRSRDDPRPMMPLRPLVLGGDDVTVVIRADLALLFVVLFTEEFERRSRDLMSDGKFLSMGVGMVAMQKSRPFARAFDLAESLLESAKARTAGAKERRSSLDYLSLMEETEADVEPLRRRLFTARDNSRLTVKPLLLDESFDEFLRRGLLVINRLSRSLTRSAWTGVRQGRDAAAEAHANLLDNLRRGVGGRRGHSLMTVRDFENIFSDGFFQKNAEGVYETALGDYLELARLLPEDGGEDFLKEMRTLAND